MCCTKYKCCSPICRKAPKRRSTRRSSRGVSKTTRVRTRTHTSTPANPHTRIPAWNIKDYEGADIFLDQICPNMIDQSMGERESDKQRERKRGMSACCLNRKTILCGLKNMHSHLGETKVTIWRLTNYIRTYLGKSINTGQQMDCNEFSNMLFDKLENLLRQTNQERLLQNIFSGK